jgi:shikimate dehydrogenase
MADAARRAFVCGHPISHSRSPLIHGHWLKTHRIAGSYEAVDVPPAAITEFFKRLAAGAFVGGNVTIPHKEAAYSLADSRDEAAEAIGAANTLWVENGRIGASNTDAYGFAANLDDEAPGWEDVKVAVVLGAGGAARAVVHALKSRGISDIRIVNRTVSRAGDLADRFGGFITAHGWEALPELLCDTDLLINTTPLGMAGEASAAPDLSPLPETALVNDLVYVPLETPLLRTARLRGLKTVGGIGMLLHQAVPGFGRWFGIRPQVTSELRAMVAADVERSA